MKYQFGTLLHDHLCLIKKSMNFVKANCNLFAELTIGNLQFAVDISIDWLYPGQTAIASNNYTVSGVNLSC